MPRQMGMGARRVDVHKRQRIRQRSIKQHLAGTMQLIDTMQETNGLLTETRELKLTKAVIRAIRSGDGDQKATAQEGHRRASSAAAMSRTAK